MDFGVLSRYDDMLANYFVDSLYLWFNTLRMNSDFVGATVDQQKVIDVLREKLFPNANGDGLRQSAAVFLDFPYFKDFVRDLPLKQATEFSQHMKRYLAMYLPNAGFEVSSTKRYTGQMEACIVATRDWKAGEQVRHCLGSIAELTAEDDAKLKREGRDFSVMVSTRKKCSCLFLGPARFMNHDCDANCSFILIGQNAITFRVERDIKCGEEMTVFYAEHYFGEYNCECRCCSCEKLQQGSFSVQQSEDEGESSLDENGNARRSIRKRKRVNYKDYFVLGQVKRAKHAEALKETTNLELASPSSVDLSQSEQGETQKAKLFDLNWSRQELDKMSRVYNWMDAQSDLSDDDNDDCNDRSRVLRKGHLNEVRCCDYADEFGIVKESTDSLRCARCYRHYKIFNHEWPLRRPRRTYGRQKQKISSIPSPPSPLSPPLSLMSPTRTRSSLNSKPPSTLDRLKTLSDQGPRIIKAWSTLEVAPICIEAAAPTIHRLEETLLADEHKHTDLPKSTHYNKSQTKTERIHVLTEKRTILQQLLERYKELLDYQQNTNYQADQEETEVCVIDPSL